VTYHRTDVGNAELFAQLNQGKLRYDYAQSRWLLWAGHWWAPDRVEQVMDCAVSALRHRLAKAATLEDKDERNAEIAHVMKSEGLSRLEAMIRRARSMHGIRHSGVGWDEQLHLIGVMNGVVDLRQGLLIDGDPNHKITKHCAFSYDPEAAAPTWERVLADIFEPSVLAYFHTAVGYSLTGETSEQCLFCLFGEGSNGKSTIMDALSHAFAPYSYTMPFSTIEFQDRSSISNDVADLVGRRFVVASETQENVRLNEGRIKALTGEAQITARQLYQKNFTFRPQAKYWLAFNHKPRTVDDTHGFWRRVRLISMLKRFGPGNCDPHLLSKLRAEAPGILRWAVEGAKLWYAHGLQAPVAVIADTEAYRMENDPLREYFEDRVDMNLADEQVWTNNTAMFEDYIAYSRRIGDRFHLGRKAFSQRLLAKNIKQAIRDGKRAWLSVELKDDPDYTPYTSTVYDT
jgi:putative DNA primase/helicase